MQPVFLFPLLILSVPFLGFSLYPKLKCWCPLERHQCLHLSLYRLLLSVSYLQPHSPIYPFGRGIGLQHNSA